MVAVQAAREAIEKRDQLSILFDARLDTGTASALRERANLLLSILPSPLTLRRVLLPAPSTAATLSVDGRRLFTAGTDCMIREVDLEPALASALPTSTAPVITELSGHGDVVSHLALSPDGAFLAAASLDQRIRIHRLDRARRISDIPLADLATGPPCASTAPIAVLAAGIERRSYRVFVQFAGALQRENMIAFARGLRDQGWNVQGADQGGERTASAAGINVIRHGSTDDAAAAQDLARQVGATSPAGRTPRVERVSTIAARTLEVWISN